MEALAGVNGALLAVYDLVKQVDAALTISDVRLERKEGGKSGTWVHPESATFGARSPRGPRPRLGRAAVITVSDRCSRGQAKDESGPMLAAGLKDMGFALKAPVVVPDERQAIAAAITKAAKTSRVVALTGGTGLSPRDVTPETVASLCDRLIPGIGEALRADGTAKLPTAALSRSLAGQLGSCLVVCLPGSRGGVRDALGVLAPLLPHALHVIDGGKH
jgi:molybdenum cofactor synthesis domain-containing protein